MIDSFSVHQRSVMFKVRLPSGNFCVVSFLVRKDYPEVSWVFSHSRLHASELSTARKDAIMEAKQWMVKNQNLADYLISVAQRYLTVEQSEKVCALLGETNFGNPEVNKHLKVGVIEVTLFRGPEDSYRVGLRELNGKVYSYKVDEDTYGLCEKEFKKIGIPFGTTVPNQVPTQLLLV